MISLTEKPDVFELEFKFLPAIVKQVQAIPGKRWDPLRKIWKVPITQREAVEKLTKRFGVVNPDTRPEYYEPIKELPSLTHELDLKMKLYEYQSKGVQYILTNRNTIIGDEMGLGKTAQAIAAVFAAKTYPCLIICPSSLKINWQREIKMWTGKNSIILTDSCKTTWPYLFKTGIADTFIVNYESLKKYFVESINTPEGAKMRLNHVKFREEINLFKSVILDEAHRCFTYNTNILTNKGWLKIGDIVENKIENITVASMDLRSELITFNPINNYWKNELSGREIFRVRHNKGEFCATGNHKVFTSAGRYKEISEIKSGEELYLLQEEFLNQELWQKHSEILQQELCRKACECEAGSKKEAFRKKKTSNGKKDLCVVWQRLREKITRKEHRGNSVLHSKLLGQMENEPTGNNSFIKNTGAKGKESFICNKTNERSISKKGSFRQNEVKESHAQPREHRKNEVVKQGQDISLPWRKRKANGPSDNFMQGTSIARGKNGARNKNREGEEQFSIGAQSLQSRFSYTRKDVGNRGRRKFSQYKEVEVFRQTKNRNIEFVRVESIEVYKPKSNDITTGGSERNQFVYDLEIANNHNYFAEGILVSNCKAPSSQQTKFSKGIAAGKEMILPITGTPVVNKPRDLVSLLMIMDKIHHFGGFKGFVNRYCAGPNEASNLRELNYLLIKHCFYARKKSEVLTELPDKVRQIILCDINNRPEYKTALKDIEGYMRNYRQATDEQIKKSMKGEIMVRIGILKNISAKGKLKDVIEMVEDVVEQGKKIVVFVHLKEVAQILIKAFPGCVTITGADNNEARQRNTDAFQKDPNVKVIICSIKAAGVGITLTAASTVAFVELPWHAADTDQCESRCHRIGQKDSVQCLYFLGKDTIDEEIYKIIDEKRTISNAITGATDEIETTTIDRLINLFNQK